MYTPFAHLPGKLVLTTDLPQYRHLWFAQHTVNNAGYLTTDNLQVILYACDQQRNLKGFGISQVVSPLGGD